MRTQIAAANWKMNLVKEEAEQLMDQLLASAIALHLSATVLII